MDEAVNWHGGIQAVKGISGTKTSHVVVCCATDTNTVYMCNYSGATTATECLGSKWGEVGRSYSKEMINRNYKGREGKRERLNTGCGEKERAEEAQLQ